MFCLIIVTYYHHCYIVIVIAIFHIRFHFCIQNFTSRHKFLPFMSLSYVTDEDPGLGQNVWIKWHQYRLNFWLLKYLQHAQYLRLKSYMKLGALDYLLIVTCLWAQTMHLSSVYSTSLVSSSVTHLVIDEDAWRCIPLVYMFQCKY